MGGGGKSGAKQASREADQARADEEARQGRIRQGTQNINDIFNGKNVGDGALAAGAAFDPSATYYNADGSAWRPNAGSGGGAGGGRQPAAAGGAPGQVMLNGQMVDGAGYRRPSNAAPSLAGNSFTGEDIMRNALRGIGPGGERASASGGSSGGGGGLSAEQQFQQMVSSGGLYSGVKNTGGFNDDFFGRQRQNYIDYATPQLDSQYGDANKQLTFALDRSGMLDSSVRGEKAGELQKAYDINRQKIADDALSYETQSRNAVEDARSNLISMLNATGDAEGAANSALARSQALSQAPSYNPLTSLFSDFTSGLGMQAAAERSFAAGGPRPAVNTGLFAPSNSAVTVRR